MPRANSPRGLLCAQYDVLFEVATDELTEEVFKVGDFAGTVNLLVEAHEEGWLAAIWHPADDARDLQVRAPGPGTGLSLR